MKMKHNYKLTDFKRMQGENSDIYDFENLASVDLTNVRELPTSIVIRLETMINRMITEYEQENNVVIPLDSMKISMQIEVDSDKRELYLQVFVGYRLEEECLHGKNIISSDNEDYDNIKKYFITEFTSLVLGRANEWIKKFEDCV